MKQSIFDNIYSKEDGYGAGSSHAITGYKIVRKTAVPQDIIEMREKHFTADNEIGKAVLEHSEYESVLFITLYHVAYIPTSIEICFWEEHLMDDMHDNTKLYADLDIETGEVSGNIPGVDNLKNYLQLVYMARYGEVVRDDC